MTHERKLSHIYLFRWSFLAFISGIISAVIVKGFSWLLDYLPTFIKSVNVAPPIWAILGAIFVGAVIYKIEPNSSGEGLPSYIEGIRFNNSVLPFSVTFFKFWAVLVTLITYGSGGIVGPIGRVNSGVMSLVIKLLIKTKFVFKKEDRQTALICGVAATVGAIFHSSVGAGILAVEIIQRSKMGYKDIFPAILASSTAHFFSKAVGWESFYKINAPREFMDVSIIGWLLLLCVIAGLAGGGYTQLYKITTLIFKRQQGNMLLKVVVGSAIASTIGWLVNPNLLGTSRNIIPAIINNDINLIAGNISLIPSTGLILLIILIIKAMCNCITVGSGMSAGFTGPTAICGMLLGASFGHFAGLDPTSPTYFALVAAGFSGMFASVMNVPLAAAIMTIEIFGLEYSFPAGFAAVIGFQITRHKTIYDYSVAGYGKSDKSKY